METIYSFILDHAVYAHWVIFGLFMLAGFNLPISEDILIILSGVLASTVIPENGWKLFTAVFLGAYLSDFIPYYLGYRFGGNLWKIPWFSRMIKPHRLDQIKHYYDKYGVLTLIFGRFIPFGVRNCLFLTAGIGKMKVLKFALSDGIACLLSNSLLFAITYSFGKNHKVLIEGMKWMNIALFSAFIIALITAFWYKRNRSSKKEVE